MKLCRSGRRNDNRLKLRRIYGVDRRRALDFCAQNPVNAAYIHQNLSSAGFGAANCVGLFEREAQDLQALAWTSGIVVPVGFDNTGLDLLAENIVARRRNIGSLVGPREQIVGLWSRLEPEWGKARDVRDPQYVMVIDEDPLPESDSSVRQATMDEVSIVFPAAVAMYTEEVGYNPSLYGKSYLQRARGLIKDGRTYIKLSDSSRTESARVIFKADVGVLTPEVAQIQGVWTAPDMRGQGIATGAMAEVVRHVRRTFAPTVSLYVNHYNHAAMKVYEKVGFRHYCEWASVLLS